MPKKSEKKEHTMTHTRSFRIEALVRDKMPQRIKKLGGYVGTYPLDSKDYSHHLQLKLREEIEEVIAATTAKDIKEEIADVLEVLHAIAQTHGLQWEHVEKKRMQKKEERGGFKKGIFAEFVEVEAEDDSHPIIEYCLSRPQEYPEI
jgi:predicted house-cleaning noncanonical NTP pyrophosphatase (MazG superfamily)